MSAQIDGDKLNSFKLPPSLEKSGPMFSAARNIQRTQMTFQIKFGAKEEAKTFLHGTNLCLSFFLMLALIRYVPYVTWKRNYMYVNTISWYHPQNAIITLSIAKMCSQIRFLFSLWENG